MERLMVMRLHAQGVAVEARINELVTLLELGALWYRMLAGVIEQNQLIVFRSDRLLC